MDAIYEELGLFIKTEEQEDFFKFFLVTSDHRIVVDDKTVCFGLENQKSKDSKNENVEKIEKDGHVSALLFNNAQEEACKKLRSQVYGQLSTLKPN